MSSTFGEHLHLSVFGQSHGPAIGMTLDGIPAGLDVDFDKLQHFLQRRAPGANAYSTPRKESDEPEFLSGIVNGKTCGAPIAAIIANTNTRSQDYDNLKSCPRPGHADYTAQCKYHGWQDAAGGGHFSGRLTAPLCIAGGLCLQWLEARGIHIGAHLQQIGHIQDIPFDAVNPQLADIAPDFPVLDSKAGKQMQALITQVRQDGDSIGGIIECAVTGLPAGIGEPMFGGVENRIAQILFGIPAIKGVEFGNGFACAALRGSENNDAFTVIDGQIQTCTNDCGGILGGITNGMPLITRVAVKPTPSIAKPQQSVMLDTMTTHSLTVSGRHDPCIAPRAVPVVEAAIALAICDALLIATGGI